VTAISNRTAPATIDAVSSFAAGRALKLGTLRDDLRQVLGEGSGLSGWGSCLKFGEPRIERPR
jgi:hypothetical protein